MKKLTHLYHLFMDKLSLLDGLPATSVHWHNGWFAIAPTNPETSTAYVLDWLSILKAKDSLENSVEV